MAPKEPIVISRAGQIAVPHEEVMRRLDVDIRGLYYRPLPVDTGKDLGDGRIINEWGVTLNKPQGGLYYDIVESPLKEATIADLEGYDWPDPLDPGRFEGLEEEAEYLYRETDYGLVGPGYETGLFEDAWALRGFESFLVDLILNPDFVHALLRRVLDVRKAMMGRFLELVGQYLDVVYIADDVAMHTGPLMSPDTYRRLVKPYQKEFFQFTKERTEAKLFYHCCGNVVPLLEDFIEMGVDIMNPVQVSAREMDTKALKARFGDRVSFWGAIDTQHVLPGGSMEEVREEVRRRVIDLAPGGGYVLAAVHNVQPDVPPENLCIMFEQAIEVGRYPLSIHGTWRSLDEP
jgi:uroporphyrinogen decarboxylase